MIAVARQIVREEGADRLTLGHLAMRAGVSKPVVYDHFGTRSGLLIELYRWIDTEKIQAFRQTTTDGNHSLADTLHMLATAYIDCVADEDGEFQAVGAALAGSEERAAVHETLVMATVQMFVAVLRPHTGLAPERLECLCIGLIGAGDALARAAVRGTCTKADAVGTFLSIMKAQFLAE
ncbi:TetR/AcrR family transcriptional regulator [Massilia sp. YMA4]|nr:TetR/AcrR family transcriptional regulator [Massilia sp. YMA4]